MNYEINYIVETHLWMATSTPYLFYTVGEDRIWLLTQNQLIDVYSNRVRPVNQLIRVSVIFKDLMYRFTTNFDSFNTEVYNTVLNNCPRFIFGKRPLSKINEINPLLKPRDYDIETLNNNLINDHCIYRESLGHTQRLGLLITGDKPKCDHTFTMLDTLVQEPLKIKVKFYRYQANNYCLKCSMIESIWNRESKTSVPYHNNYAILDVPVTKFLFS